MTGERADGGAGDAAEGGAGEAAEGGAGEAAEGGAGGSAAGGSAAGGSAAGGSAPAARRTVAVIGGGISGLAAAWELTGGADGPASGSPSVAVLEADDRTGGKLRTASLAGRDVDVGPDGFLGRRPEAETLCRELGLGDDLVPIGASGAAVWARGARRPLPEGSFLGVPTRLLPVARSGILSPAGTLRLLVDVVAPRPDRRGPLGDRAIGPLVGRKLGRQVVTRLVEPLLGGIYAGSVADSSAAAVLPALLNVSQGRSSLMRSVRRVAARGPAAPGPVPAGKGRPTSGEEPADGGSAQPSFWALRGGLGRLADRLTGALVLRGVDVRTACTVTGLEREDGRWTLRTTKGEMRADAVVLALPATPAAALLSTLDADAAAPLQAMAYASVAVVTLAFADASVPDDLYGTGLLVPIDTPLPEESAAELGAPPGETCMVTACTYLSTKWPNLAQPGQRLIRASVGRYGDDRFQALGDDALVERVIAELRGLIDLSGDPTASMVTRWPESLPQYRVHHLMRVGGVESSVRRLGAVAVAGAAYRGVGIPACIASGRAAAREVLAQLAGAGDLTPAT